VGDEDSDEELMLFLDAELILEPSVN